MNYFIAPRSGEKSYKNYESTIKNGVPLERISQYLSDQEIEILSKEEIIYAWGNRKGTVGAWKKIQDGDLVIFYANKRLIMTGEVYFKKHSPDIALALWPPDEHGNPWEYVFFIKNINYISIPISIFNAAAKWKSNNIIQGFTYLNEERVKNIIDQYGSVEKLLGLFVDQYSEEIPLESDKLYVNITHEIKPIIITDATFTPRANNIYKTKKLAKKIDYIARNKSNSITGSKGEKLVLSIEQKRLHDAGKPELANKVERISIGDDSKGYDILSFEVDGKERYIEVKTTTIDNNGVRFFVSLNEYEIGKTKDNYYIYFVENINSESPKITIIKNPIDKTRFSIKPDGYIFEANR